MGAVRDGGIVSTSDGKVDAAKPGFLRRYCPILGWLASCNRRWLAEDAAAGLSVWAPLAPQAPASAELIRRRRPAPASDLHRCQLCDDDSVVPIEAAPLDPGRWEMRLRCGQCGTYREVIVSDRVAKRYDEELNRGMGEIAAALKREDRERMTAEVRVFVAALEHDLIDAEDFASD
jgi:hypothetical protein